MYSISRQLMMKPRQDFYTTLACCLSLVALGCDSIASLRQYLPVAQQERDVGVDSAGLTVEVEPPLGISIFFDGAKVATTSPYINRNLLAGPHTLHVRAMGYHAITLPVSLKKH